MIRIRGTYELSREQIHQLIKSLGEEKSRRILDGNEVLSGRLTVEFKESVKQLFDENGRRTPGGLEAEICSPNQKFNLVQPKLGFEEDFDSRIERLHESWCINTKITGQQFKQETERLLQIIKRDPLIANISSGVYLPVILPKLSINDIGSQLELYLSAVNHSYKKIFSFRKFNNHRQGNLRGEISIANGSRHEQLIQKMKEGSVVGLYFPEALQGFSIYASRGQMSALPEGFILSGLDTAISMIMYPDVLAKNFNTPGLDLAALQYKSLERSLYFEAYDGKLVFSYSGYLADANDNYSSGLFFFR